MFRKDPELAHVKWVLPHSYVASFINQLISAADGDDSSFHFLISSMMQALCVPLRPIWVLKCHRGVSAVFQRQNEGNNIYSRFDIYSFGFKTVEDEDGMLTSVELIRGLIGDEIRSGIDPSRIVLGGFSQGGAMSLLTALTLDFKLAGVVCMSGWLPLQHKIKSVRITHPYLNT
jgi:predicted esterase